jgi:hypothetical protein
MNRNALLTVPLGNLFSASVWVTERVGKARAWFAKGYREGLLIEQYCIFPIWLLLTVTFNVMHKITHILYHLHKISRGVEQPGSSQGS